MYRTSFGRADSDGMKRTTEMHATMALAAAAAIMTFHFGLPSLHSLPNPKSQPTRRINRRSGRVLAVYE